jgi:hypothetical protein
MWLSHRQGRAQTHGRRLGVGLASGWLGDGQRACPRVEAGETDAAEPGQAETGPADQATMEHARIESKSTRAGEWWRTGTHTHSHRDRGRQTRTKHGRNPSHRSHDGSSDPTGCEQQSVRGLGQEPCALQDRRLYISAPRFPLCQRDRTMKHHNRMKPMPSPQYCAQQEFLRHLARLAGVNAVTVWAVGKNRYQLSVLIQGKPLEWFLATRREPRVPRAFTRLDTAFRLGQRLFKVASLTVVCRP